MLSYCQILGKRLDQNSKAAHIVPKSPTDEEFWLAGSEGKVMVALSITVTRSKITIERWELKSRNDKMIIQITNIGTCGMVCMVERSNYECTS